MNYVVMDEIEDTIPNYENISNKKNNKKNYLVVFVILLILISVFLIIFLLNRNSFDKYINLEKSIVNEAGDYVRRNNLNTLNGLYIPVSKFLSFKLDDECSSVSGVIIENNLYYPNLVCNNYKSNIIHNEEKYGKLIGDELIIIDKNYEYHDLGVDSQYEVELINNYVNREGIYTYLYKIKNNNTILETITRKVIVFDNAENMDYPLISLKGEEIIYLTIGDVYSDDGVLATDKRDGNISSKVNIINNVNYNQVGEYDIKYTVTNSLGYSSSVVRKVIIGEKSEDDKIVISNIMTPVGQTNDKVRIIIMIQGNDYKHTILPDGTTVTDTLFEYEVLQNGTFDFLVYDKNENVVTKQIVINNIDKEVPNGTCNAVVFKQYTEVKISNVSEESCVFNYETNNYTSIYMSDNNYKLPVGNIENVSVNIKDLAGNVNKIKCNVEKDLSVINKEYISDKGYHCIEPYTCFKQWDYTSDRYCYYSTETCGPINKRGCSITSVATVLSKWDKRSSNGQLFNPYTLMDEVDVYRRCSSCSGTTTTRKAIESFGLQVIRNPENNNDWFSLNMKNHDILLNHLKNGDPAIIRVSGNNNGWYTNGGHIMPILTANEEGLVFLSDTSTKKGTKNGKGHDVNTFVPLTDVINHCGSNCTFQLIKE